LSTPVSSAAVQPLPVMPEFHAVGATTSAVLCSSVGGTATSRSTLPTSGEARRRASAVSSTSAAKWGIVSKRKRRRPRVPSSTAATALRCASRIISRCSMAATRDSRPSGSVATFSRTMTRELPVLATSAATSSSALLGAGCAWAGSACSAAAIRPADASTARARRRQAPASTGRTKGGAGRRDMGGLVGPNAHPPRDARRRVAPGSAIAGTT
jgi:hypothetical protein